jgi:hypothetical protein
VRGCSLLKLELFVFHNTDNFYLPAPIYLALSVIFKNKPRMLVNIDIIPRFFMHVLMLDWKD